MVDQMNQKIKWKGCLNIPSSKAQSRMDWLKLEPHPQPHVERQAIARGQRNGRRLQEVRVVYPQVQLVELVRVSLFPNVRHVEEIGDKADPHLLVDHVRIVGVQVDLIVLR
jgi:hypothetical protein